MPHMPNIMSVDVEELYHAEYVRGPAAKWAQHLRPRAVRGLEIALRLLEEEVLPVFRRLGLAPGQAVAMARMADILKSRGKPDDLARADLLQKKAKRMLAELGLPEELMIGGRLPQYRLP